MIPRVIKTNEAEVTLTERTITAGLDRTDFLFIIKRVINNDIKIRKIADGEKYAGCH